MNDRQYDKVILGAGFYGLYAALRCGLRGERVAVVERDSIPFARATYVNQARVHMGYHYPRSLATAQKSAGYFRRFVDDYGFCVKKDFAQVYATSSRFSWTNGKSFAAFCRTAGIPCEELPVQRYFRPGMCDGAFLTKEYTYDAKVLRDKLTHSIDELPNVDLLLGMRPTAIERGPEEWELQLSNNNNIVLHAPFVLNATYAGVNDVHALIGASPFGIKYELCEIILCDVGQALKGLGLTVMDGPFFSVMPFGLTGLHSLTSVTFTPHDTSYDSLPTFSCQKNSQGTCEPGSLGNCNECVAKPQSAWPYMSQLAHKYVRDEYTMHYKRSLYSMKPILTASEVDDSRPTVIRMVSRKPMFVSVLSGKVNTVYDLDHFLDGTF